MNSYFGHKIAEYLCELSGLTQDDKDDKEIVAYGLEYVLFNALGIALTLLAGLMLNLFYETISVLFCWGLMRVFAGGAHCTSRWRCTAVSFVTLILAVIIARLAFSYVPNKAYIIVLSIWTLFAIWRWAPNNSEKPVHDSEKRKKIKIRAFCLALSTGLIIFYLFTLNARFLSVSVAGATGFAAGALMLSPFGLELIIFLDKKLELMHQHFLKRR